MDETAADEGSSSDFLLLWVCWRRSTKRRSRQWEKREELLTVSSQQGSGSWTRTVRNSASIYQLSLSWCEELKASFVTSSWELADPLLLLRHDGSVSEDMTRCPVSECRAVTRRDELSYTSLSRKRSTERRFASVTKKWWNVGQRVSPDNLRFFWVMPEWGFVKCDSVGDANSSYSPLLSLCTQLIVKHRIVKVQN